MNSTSDRLYALTKEIVDPTQRDGFTKSSMLFEERILDSLGLMQLLAVIDQEFSIVIETEDLTTQNFASVNHISDLVDRYLKKGI